MQTDEGQPPMEVDSTEQQSLRWQKDEELRDKWKRRQNKRRAGEESQGVEMSEADSMRVDEAPAEECARSTGEETGTLFDDRS